MIEINIERKAVKNSISLLAFFDSNSGGMSSFGFIVISAGILLIITGINKDKT